MKFVFVLFSVVAFSSWAHGPDSIRSEKRAERLFVIHEVEEEETLFSIARRYRSSVDAIRKHNEITENNIDIGQVLSVLVIGDREERSKNEVEVPENAHLVKQGETLYSISRLYDLNVKEIKKLNDLKHNAISPGQILAIGKGQPSIEAASPSKKLGPGPNSEIELIIEKTLDFKKYLVQAGETLVSISKKFSVSVESIKEWNNLTSHYIRIGQELLIAKDQGPVKMLKKDEVGVGSKLDEDGFERVFEKGTASVIEDIKTTKYLALHRSLPIGTELAVRNLMNNLVVHVKVVGQLPDTGINRGLMLRLSTPAYDLLGILDSKSRVEASYCKQ